MPYIKWKLAILKICWLNCCRWFRLNWNVFLSLSFFLFLTYARCPFALRLKPKLIVQLLTGCCRKYVRNDLLICCWFLLCLCMLVLCAVVLFISALQSFNGINGNDLTFSEISFKRTSIKILFIYQNNTILHWKMQHGSQEYRIHNMMTFIIVLHKVSIVIIINLKSQILLFQSNTAPNKCTFCKCTTFYDLCTIKRARTMFLSPWLLANS